MDILRDTLTELLIIQFNYNHLNHSKRRPFFDALNPQSQYIIAIQEPHLLSKGRTYYPYGYTLAISEDPATRVVFLVSNELRVAD